MSEAQHEPASDEAAERRFAFRALDQVAIARLIAPAAAPGRRVAAFEPLTGGKINTIYKVWLDGENEPLVLRLYARAPASEICAREVALLGRVAGRVPAPRVLHADPAGAESDGAPYCVTTFIPGVPLAAVLAGGDEGAIASAGRAVGAVRAALNAFTFPQAGLLGPDLSLAHPFGDMAAAVRGYVLNCLDQSVVRERLGDDLARQTERGMNTAFPWLETVVAAAGPPCLVHSDFQATNLLVDRSGENGDWRVSGLLDWEWAHADTPLFDLAILLRNQQTPLPPGFADAVAHGYTDAGGALPNGWERAARVVDLVNLFEFLAGPGDLHGTKVASVRAIVETTVNDLDELS